MVMVVLLKAHGHDCGLGYGHKNVFRIYLISCRDCPEAASSGCLTKFEGRNATKSSSANDKNRPIIILTEKLSSNVPLDPQPDHRPQRDEDVRPCEHLRLQDCEQCAVLLLRLPGLQLTRPPPCPCCPRRRVQVKAWQGGEGRQGAQGGGGQGGEEGARLHLRRALTSCLCEPVPRGSLQRR